MVYKQQALPVKPHDERVVERIARAIYVSLYRRDPTLRSCEVAARAVLELIDPPAPRESYFIFDDVTKALVPFHPRARQ